MAPPKYPDESQRANRGRGVVVGLRRLLLVGTALALLGAGTSAAPGGASTSLADPPTVVPDVGAAPEGNAGVTSLQVPVALSAASTDPVTVEWTTLVVSSAPAGQADPATDYTPTSGVVTFAPGETSRSVSIPVGGDVLSESDEYVVVSFHDPTNAVMGGFWGLGFGVISDDDLPVVFFPPGGGEPGSEGGSAGGVLDIPVRLSHPSIDAVTVQWTTLFVPDVQVFGQADPVADYSPTSGVVTFAPGETSRSVSIQVSPDTLVEGVEWLAVSFHDPTNAVMGGFWGLGFGLILDDD